ncbi:MAG: hypothetical protein Q8918_17900 [Bacteroidota bacterium]|nr:hypothetical protein [Bacteroidota bacterium]MDP4251978.1 hypothetical protein [Bacteroidota bacterium]
MDPIATNNTNRSRYAFHVNIISNRWQLEAVYLIYSVPGLAFLILSMVFLKLKLQHHYWYFFFALAGSFASLIMAFFPFYSNAMLYVSSEGIVLERRKSIVRTIKWSDIQYINFENRGAPSDYGNHIETIIRLQGEEVRFGVYRFLFRSKRKITRELIRTLLKFPDAGNKLPEELVARYSATDQ